MVVRTTRGKSTAMTNYIASGEIVHCVHPITEAAKAWLKPGSGVVKAWLRRGWGLGVAWLRHG